MKNFFKISIFISFTLHVLVLFLVGFIIDNTMKNKDATREVVLILSGSNKKTDSNIMSNLSIEGGSDKTEETTASAKQLLNKTGSDAKGNANRETKKSDSNPLISDKFLVSISGETKFNSGVLAKQTLSEHDKNRLIGSQYDNQIASLITSIKEADEELSKNSKTKLVEDYSTSSTPEAKYVIKISNIIEDMGKIYYPQDAISNNITGDVQVSMIIDKTGQLVSYEILRSGGEVLDESIGKILAQAQYKFPKFDENMSNYNQVEFIRTWRFEKGFKIK